MFLKGFREAVGLAVPIVAVYIALNLVVLAWGLHAPVAASFGCFDLVGHRDVRATDNPATMFLVALLLFPSLALGLSGFETGVAVMPLVRGDPDDTAENPKGRIRNTKKLLTAAALLMSVLLAASSIVTTLLIPPAEFAEGGAAYGRALAYIAHEHLGEAFGTIYDISTMAILWFAGASAMVGLLNLVPRYLPRYGMAPEWAKAHRPLVVIFTAVTFLVTHPVQSRRERARRRVRDRRAGADGIGGSGRHARGVARAAGPWLGYALSPSSSSTPRSSTSSSVRKASRSRRSSSSRSS